MFTSIFGKRKSPVEDNTPPIPGPKSDDGFIVIDNATEGGLYPNVSGGSLPSVSPQRPAPPTPRRPQVDQTFHYLQGVPFSLSRELQMATNKDSLSTEITDQLAFMTGRMKMNSYDYQFSVEKSVLREY